MNASAMGDIVRRATEAATEAVEEELAALNAARTLRERILADSGSLLPDSAEELRALREERHE
jgi:hypothetical protein